MELPELTAPTVQRRLTSSDASDVLFIMFIRSSLIPPRKGWKLDRSEYMMTDILVIIVVVPLSSRISKLRLMCYTIDCYINILLH